MNCYQAPVLSIQKSSVNHGGKMWNFNHAIKGGICSSQINEMGEAPFSLKGLDWSCFCGHLKRSYLSAGKE